MCRLYFNRDACTLTGLPLITDIFPRKNVNPPLYKNVKIKSNRRSQYWSLQSPPNRMCMELREIALYAIESYVQFLK